MELRRNKFLQHTEYHYKLIVEEMIELSIFYEMVQIQRLSHPHLSFSICKTWE